MEATIIPQYLANIIEVIVSDNILHENEKKSLEIIAKDIGAKKTDLKKAEKTAESGKTLPVGRLSDKLRNIEDMVFVAMVDGNISEEEEKLIHEFFDTCFKDKILGIDEQILTAIKNECRNRVSIFSDGTTCANCKAEITTDCKFCPECGSKLAEQEEIQPEIINLSFNYPLSGLSIEFCESTSANHKMALEEAKKAPDFQSCIKSKKNWYLATWPMSHLTEALPLATCLSGIRNRRLYLDANEVEWNEILGFKWCYKRRDQSYEPCKYCFGFYDDRYGFNLCGCIHSGLYWNYYNSWMTIGNFSEEGVFVKNTFFNFDKKRIKHYIETNLFPFKYCPLINFEYIEKIIDLLPEKINMHKDDRWEFNNCQGFEGGIKVTEKRSYGNYEYYSNGVCPKYKNTAYEIMLKAINACYKEAGDIINLLK